MRIIFLAHVSSLSLIRVGLGSAWLADPNSEMRNQKCQKPVELNKYFDSRQGKGQDKDSRQNKGQLTGGATRPQIAINMPEIGIQKMRSEGSSCLQLGSTRRANRGNLCQNCCAENMRNCHCSRRRRTGGLSEENVWENPKKISPKRNHSKSGS